MLGRRVKLPSLKRHEGSIIVVMQIDQQTLMLLSIPRHKRKAFEFRKEAISRRRWRLSGPSVHMKVIGKVGAKPPRNSSSQISCRSDSGFAYCKEAGQELAIQNGGRGKLSVAPEAPYKSVKHVQNGREALRI
jgi:hypothetical protein